MRGVLARLLTLALAGLLVACGTNAPPVLTGPTATTVPSGLPTADPAAAHTCATQTPKPVTYVQLGDLLFSRATLGALSYPAVMLPASVPLKPMQVTTAVSNNVWSIGGPLAALPPANPGLEGNGAGYELIVCNASASAHHTVQAVSARIQTLTPFSGQLSVWKACDSAYSRQQPSGGGGCGGFGFYDETMKVSFSGATGQGATATATQLSDGLKDGGPSQVGPLPYTLAPGQAITINVQLAPLTTPGIYILAFGVKVDGVATSYMPAVQAALHAPVAHTFTGAACQQSSMARQIPPATTPPSYFICPQA
jgi:hypothetical protein